jgi:hypothetical protein
LLEICKSTCSPLPEVPLGSEILVQEPGTPFIDILYCRVLPFNLNSRSSIPTPSPLPDPPETVRFTFPLESGVTCVPPFTETDLTVPTYKGELPIIDSPLIVRSKISV